MLEDERFRSSMETESEEYWMPIQVLNTVFCTPTLSEEVQVEIMKVCIRYIYITNLLKWYIFSRNGLVYVV